jgi:YEATS domain-contaning protein 2
LKEQESLKIEEEILKTKKLLQELRYALASNYYKSSSSETQKQAQESIEENAIISSGVQDLDQRPVHPSLKKLIGKKPRPKRKTAQEAIVNINEKFTKRKVSRLDSVKTVSDQSAGEGSGVAQLTSYRGRHQMKHKIAVGNTAQSISEDNSPVIHRWMCYVTITSEMPLEKLVEKVQFHLDSSYKPNDVIEVCSAPFHLTRRGYKEFLVRLVIFFKDEIDLKPIQVFHQLVFDKNLTGKQIIVKETVSEFLSRYIPGVGGSRTVVPATEVSSHPLKDHDYFLIEEANPANS